MPWEHKDGTLISQIDQNSQIEYFQYYFKLLIQNQNWNRVCSFEKEKSHRYRLKMLDFMVLKYRDQFESMIFHKFSYNSIPACIFMFEHQAVRGPNLGLHVSEQHSMRLWFPVRIDWTDFFEIFAIIISYKKFLIHEHIVIILSLKWIKTTWRRHNRLLTHWNKAEHVLLKLNGLNRGNIETTSEWKL